MTRLLCLTLGAVITMAIAMNDAHADEPKSAFDFEMKSLGGESVDLEKYKGKVVLVANTASRCGATPQYADLQALYEKYKDDGLVILGFPCNQFGGQEPGTSEQISSFCQVNYGVTFPMFSKVDVNGADEAPLFSYLKSTAEDSGDVSWNFEKFLVGKDGKVLERFRTGTNPSDANVVASIESALGK